MAIFMQNILWMKKIKNKGTPDLNTSSGWSMKMAIIMYDKMHMIPLQYTHDHVPELEDWQSWKQKKVIKT